MCRAATSAGGTVTGHAGSGFVELGRDPGRALGPGREQSGRAYRRDRGIPGAPITGRHDLPPFVSGCSSSCTSSPSRTCLSKGRITIVSARGGATSIRRRPSLPSQVAVTKAEPGAIAVATALAALTRRNSGRTLLHSTRRRGSWAASPSRTRATKAKLSPTSRAGGGARMVMARSIPGACHARSRTVGCGGPGSSGSARPSRMAAAPAVAAGSIGPQRIVFHQRRGTESSQRLRHSRKTIRRSLCQHPEDCPLHFGRTVGNPFADRPGGRSTCA